MSLPWALLAMVVAMCQTTDAFMYRPKTGLTWDPSCMTWNNKSYCYFMYVCGSTTTGCNSTNETHYGHGLVAASDDGVHFEDHSAFNAEYPGVVWDKCMIHKVKDVDGKPMFVMDHGTSGAVKGPDSPSANLPNDRGCPAGSSQCLRFLKSTDAVTWEYMYTLHPDIRWYKSDKGVSKGRWDHAYIQEDTKRGGFIAFPVATPAAPRPPAPGILRSPDGLNWTVEEPVVTDWTSKGVTPAGFEVDTNLAFSVHSPYTHHTLTIQYTLNIHPLLAILSLCTHTTDRRGGEDGEWAVLHDRGRGSLRLWILYVHASE
jgi:hypothetical protein